MSSCEECAPNRPPRVQKFPLASGTVQFDTTIGCFSMVESTNHTIWGASPPSSRHLQELLAVDNLEDAAAVGAVGEINAVALRPGRDHAVDGDRNGAGCAGLL